MARGLGETTCLLSVCGEASNTRRCICELTRASVKPAAPLDAISTSTMASVPIRALTALRRTRLTSPSCPSAWQPNPGRGSTYRRGNSVQRIETTAVGLGRIGAAAPADQHTFHTPCSVPIYREEAAETEGGTRVHIFALLPRSL